MDVVKDCIDGGGGRDVCCHCDYELVCKKWREK